MKKFAGDKDKYEKICLWKKSFIDWLFVMMFKILDSNTWNIIDRKRWKGKTKFNLIFIHTIIGYGMHGFTKLWLL